MTPILFIYTLRISVSVFKRESYYVPQSKISIVEGIGSLRPKFEITVKLNSRIYSIDASYDISFLP